MQALARAGVTAAAVLLVVDAPRRARAGNEDTVPLSNEAAIEGGAVTATVRGGGAAYTNPAGLAHGEADRLDVTATTYVLRLADLPALGEGGPGVPVTAQKLTTIDLTTVPSSLAYVRRLSQRVVGSFGVFVPTVVDRNLTATVSTRPAPGQPDVDFGSDVREKRGVYVAGPSFGIQVTPQLALGAGLFAIYERSHQSFDILVAQRTGGQLTAFATATNARDVVSIGAQLVLGAQWAPTRHLRVGATLRSPRQQVYAISQRIQLESSGDAGPPVALDARPTTEEVTGFRWLMIAPPRLDLGIAWEADGWRVAVDGTFVTRHAGNVEQAPLKPTANLRVGGRVALSRVVAIGGGLFTDRSQAVGVSAIGLDADFYGISLGAELGSFYLATPSPPPSSASAPRPTPLTFRTAIALRYAVGVGRTGGIALTPNREQLFTTYAQDLVLHEIGLHLGSSLLF